MWRLSDVLDLYLHDFLYCIASAWLTEGKTAHMCVPNNVNSENIYKNVCTITERSWDHGATEAKFPLLSSLLVTAILASIVYLVSSCMQETLFYECVTAWATFQKGEVGWSHRKLYAWNWQVIKMGRNWTMIVPQTLELLMSEFRQREFLFLTITTLLTHGGENIRPARWSQFFRGSYTLVSLWTVWDYLFAMHVR